jgi:hypothetical protein
LLRQTILIPSASSFFWLRAMMPPPESHRSTTARRGEQKVIQGEEKKTKESERPHSQSVSRSNQLSQSLPSLQSFFFAPLAASIPLPLSFPCRIMT